MMNICSTCQGAQSRVPGAPRRRLRLPRAHQRDARGRGASSYERGHHRTRTSSGCWSRTIGLDELAAKVKRPLDGPARRPVLRLLHRAPHATGSATTSTPSATSTSSSVIEALGGEVVEYDGARKCCGFPVITMNRETSLRQAGTPPRRRASTPAPTASSRPCPLCHLNLDLQQPEAAKVVDRDLGLAGPAPAAARRPRARLRAEGARHEQAHRLDRLVDEQVSAEAAALARSARFCASSTSWPAARWRRSPWAAPAAREARSRIRLRSSRPSGRREQLGRRRLARRRRSAGQRRGCRTRARSASGPPRESPASWVAGTPSRRVSRRGPAGRAQRSPAGRSRRSPCPCPCATSSPLRGSRRRDTAPGAVPSSRVRRLPVLPGVRVEDVVVAPG